MYNKVYIVTTTTKRRFKTNTTMEFFSSIEKAQAYFLLQCAEYNLNSKKLNDNPELWEISEYKLKIKISVHRVK